MTKLNLETLPDRINPSLTAEQAVLQGFIALDIPGLEHCYLSTAGKIVMVVEQVDPDGDALIFSSKEPKEVVASVGFDGTIELLTKPAPNPLDVLLHGGSGADAFAALTGQSEEASPFIITTGKVVQRDGRSPVEGEVVQAVVSEAFLKSLTADQLLGSFGGFGLGSGGSGLTGFEDVISTLPFPLTPAPTDEASNPATPAIPPGIEDAITSFVPLPVTPAQPTTPVTPTTQSPQEPAQPAPTPIFNLSDLEKFPVVTIDTPTPATPLTFRSLDDLVHGISV